MICKSKLLGTVGGLLFVSACVTAEAERTEREVSRGADPAARADIISDPAVREGVYEIEVWGGLTSIPARFVYSSPVHSITVSFDPRVTTRDAVLENVGGFCKRNGFGPVKSVIDGKVQTLTKESKRVLAPHLQIACAEFNAKSLL